VADSHQLQEYLKNPGKFSPENKKIQSTIFPIQEDFIANHRDQAEINSALTY